MVVTAVLRSTSLAAHLYARKVGTSAGTAQNRGHDHSAFMGFAPMNNPQIAVCVYVENGGFGADFAVPLGSLIMEQFVNGKLSPASEAKANTFQHRHISYGKQAR